MHRTQRARGAAAVHHRGDVALGGALGDGAHAHPGGAECAEHLGGDAGRARHAVADHREDRQIGVDVHALDLSLDQLTLEGPPRDVRGALGLLLRDRAADRVLRASLRDQDDRYALFAQRAEQPMRGTRHADHAGAFEVDERHPLDAGDPLDRERRGGPRADQRPDLLGCEGVADPDRDLVADRGRHGLRVKDPRSEVGELHRLVVGQRIDHRRVGHAARVGRQHPVDIGPDVDLRRFQQGAEDRRGEVAAVAAECGLHAAFVGGDEAGDDECAGEIAGHQRLEVGARLRPLDSRPERSPLHRDHPSRVQPLHRAGAPAARGEEAQKQPGRPDLAVAGDQVADVAVRGARELHCVQNALEVAAIAVELLQVLLRDGLLEQRRGDRRMSRAQVRDLPEVGVVLTLGERDETQQRIGHAAARRQHDAQARAGGALEYRGNSAEAVGVRDARPPELVHDPGIGLGHRRGISSSGERRCDSIKKRRGSPTGGTPAAARPGACTTGIIARAWKHTSYPCCPCSSASGPQPARWRSASWCTPRARPTASPAP